MAACGYYGAKRQGLIPRENRKENVSSVGVSATGDDYVTLISL